MKMRVFIRMIAGVVLAAIALQHTVKSSNAGASDARAALRSALPAKAAAKTILNSTHRHREWVNVPAGSTGVRAFIVYPERSDKAPVVVVTANKEGASDWIRTVSDKVAAESFIAVVPDVLSGMGPNGGDSNSYRNPEAVAQALDRLDRDEMARRVHSVRQYALALPASDGQSAQLEFHSGIRRSHSGGDRFACR